MDRVYNVEKSRKRKYGGDLFTSPRKRGRPPKPTTLESRYPIISPTSPGQVEALAIELTKEKPRKELVLKLMKETFSERRNFNIHSAVSVKSIVEKFPALKMIPAVF